MPAGKQLNLNINGGVNFGFSANAALTIPGDLLDGDDYVAAVIFTTFGVLCTLTNASGTIDAANVTNLVVSCVPAYLVSFSTQTLAAGQTLVIQNNGGEDKTVSGPNGASSFTTPVLDVVQRQHGNGAEGESDPANVHAFLSDGELRIRVTNQGLGNGDLSTLFTSNNSFVVAFDQNGNPSDWTTLHNGFADHVLANNHIAGTTAQELTRPRP